jgi:ketosteroid isomerase-like protein
MVTFRQPTDDRKRLSAAEAVHEAWNDALARKDANALAALHTDGAIIEGPLVSGSHRR